MGVVGRSSHPPEQFRQAFLGQNDTGPENAKSFFTGGRWDGRPGRKV